MKDIKSIYTLIKQLAFILNKKQKIQMFGIFFLILLGSIGDLLGVSAIIPFVQVISDKDAFVRLGYVKKIMAIFHLDGTNIIVFLAVAIIALYVVKNAIMLLVNYEQFKFGRTVERDISVALFTAYMHETYEYHINHSSGEALRGITHDTNGVYEAMRNILSLLSNVTSIIMLVAFLVVINPTLAIGTILVGGITFCIVTVLTKKVIKGLGEKTRYCEAEKNKYALQGINGIKEILVNRKQEWFISGYREAFVRFTKIHCRYGFANSFPNRLIETICVCVLILFVGFNASITENVGNLVSELAAFALAAFRMLPMLGVIIESINSLVFNRVRVDGVYQSLQNVHCQNLPSNSDNSLVEQTNSFAKIELKDICFAYLGSENSVLDGINMEICRGQMIGIIGESGAGKTTLVDVLIGLLKPNRGQILLDGTEIDGMDVATMVGYVPQEVFIVDDTIRRNIAFGIKDSQIDDMLLSSAIEDAQLMEYVNELPDGIETIVGESGSRMSGGQRQRIAIARALYKQPGILVFDEATSALDNNTEKSVMDAINSLHGKITVVIIAHRLSTIEKCDVIYRVENGKVTQMCKEDVAKC